LLINYSVRWFLTKTFLTNVTAKLDDGYTLALDVFSFNFMTSAKTVGIGFYSASVLIKVHFKLLNFVY